MKGRCPQRCCCFFPSLSMPVARIRAVQGPPSFSSAFPRYFNMIDQPSSQLFSLFPFEERERERMPTRLRTSGPSSFSFLLSFSRPIIITSFSSSLEDKRFFTAWAPAACFKKGNFLGSSKFSREENHEKLPQARPGNYPFKQSLLSSFFFSPSQFWFVKCSLSLFLSL